MISIVIWWLFSLVNRKCYGGLMPGDDNVIVVESGWYMHDNFVLFGSEFEVKCNCSGITGITDLSFVIREETILGKRLCQCPNANFRLAYRTCTIDEYLAYQSCKKTAKSNVCIRIKSFVKAENHCQALTDVMKREYCVDGSYQRCNFYYERNSYDSLCHLLSFSPSSLDFGKQSKFSLLGVNLTISSVYDKIALYKIIKVVTINSCNDLQRLSSRELNSKYPNIKRLVASETTLVDNRTLICIACSETYSYRIYLAYYKDSDTKVDGIIIPYKSCRGIERFYSIDISKVIEQARYLTYVRVWIYFRQLKFEFGYFGFRLITA
uniref:Uncharacterized protein n=1 Tax=Romanomermis culicivorax TaxID=13658 RepID=A0A915JQV1_ROMCU